MWLIALTMGCLLDRATYEARLAELTDDDGDGFSEVDGDCDDGATEIGPEASERCNGADDDCDGLQDEADDLADAAWFADADGDGVGGGEAVVTCDPAEGMVAASGDCDDTDADVRPGAPERCNGADDDCDGEVDDPGEVAPLDWYADGDGDGFGSGAPIASCPDPGDASLTDGDCDDADADVHPGAEEECNGVDDDCNGAVDDAPAITWYLDRDGDGFGDDGTTYLVCTPPPGYADEGGDCDDLDEDRHPGAPEVCEDGEDSDCDGLESTCGLGGGELDGSDMSARFSVSGSEDYVARTVAAGGDLDGDGIDELIVSRPGWDGLTGALAFLRGREELYLGDLDLDLVATHVHGGAELSAFGFALDAGDDTDGDGTGDVLVSALYEDRAYLFADGAALLRGGLDVDDATLTLIGPTQDVSFGVSVALLGDLDGDGWGDWLVGDYLYEGSGAAFLYYGSGGTGTVTVDDPDVAVLRSTGASEDGGHQASNLGDLDGDGRNEFGIWDASVDTVDAHHRGFVFVSDGLRLSSGAPIDSAETYTGAVDEDTFAVMAEAGDLNGDGRGDAAFSAPGANGGAGAVFVLLGDPMFSGGGAVETLASARWVGPEVGAAMGRSVAAVGDLDGGGSPALAAGNSRTDAGGASLWLLDGRADFSGTYEATDVWAAVAGAGSEPDAESIASAGDVNGDGVADLLAAAWPAVGTQGEAWLAYGSP